MKRFSWMLIFVMLLGVVVAPQVLAESPKNAHAGAYMSKEDAHRAMDAVMKLKHHPYQLKEMSVEKLTWLLRGMDHLAKMPFVDHRALFDLQLKLSLHLLDIQVKRLQHIYKYSYYPWDYGYMNKYHDYGYGAYGYDRDYGRDRGMMDKADMKKPYKMDYEGMDRGCCGYDGGSYGDYQRYSSMPVKHMHHMKGIMVKKMQFHSARGCHLNQADATREHARHNSIFVGPCQQVGHDAWTFNVWWV